MGAELPCTVLCPSANGPAASAPDVHPADVDAPKVSSGTTDANADTDNTGKADSPHDGGILHAGHNPGKGNSGENAKHWDGGNGVSGMDGRIGAGEDGFGSDAHRESGENAGGKGGMYRDRDQETARTDVNETDEGGRNSAAGKQQERVEGERTHESNGKTAEASGGAKVKNESMMGRDRGTGDRGAKGNDETACLHSPVWGPCDATCEQEMSAGEQCRGRRRVRCSFKQMSVRWPWPANCCAVSTPSNDAKHRAQKGLHDGLAKLAAWWFRDRKSLFLLPPIRC